MNERNIDDSFLDALEDDPFKAVCDFNAERLPASDKATSFLLSKYNITPERAHDEKIGFSDRRLGKCLPSNDSKRGLQLRDMLKKLGLLKTSGHEALGGCATFPLYDEDGNVTGIFGRRIDRKARGPKEVTVGTGTMRVSLDQNAAPPCNDVELTKAIASERATKVEKEEPTSEAKEEPTPDNAPTIKIEESEVIFTCDDRRYRVRGLQKNTNPCSLKVNIMASRDELVHLDSLDLVKARSRASFIKAAGAELFVDVELIKRDIGKMLLQLEELREQQIAKAKSPLAKPVELSEAEINEAIKLLRDPKLLQRIVADLTACGMVGEDINKLVGYLAATSRMLKSPLAIVIQSSSSAGKTSLMDAILAMMPEEDQLRFSGITSQSLFYLQSDQIRHKILAISEDEGASRATYALKLLQSEGELRHGGVSRDENGNMVTEATHVKGPVQFMMTSTAMDIDEELVNRGLVLTVDESRNQTGDILSKQRDARMFETFVSGIAAERIQRLHQNAQRLLKPLRVFNPYASQLTFPTHKTRLRRDHQKYLTLIDTVALLHQYQRETYKVEIDGKTIEYINVEPSDIAVANGIAGEVLGRSLDDLSPQTRRLLMLLHEFVSRQSKADGVSGDAFRFTRRDVREATQWSDFQVHTHLSRLVELEYLIAHRGKRGSRFVYELLYRGEGHESQPFLIGLIDPSKLQEPPTTTTSSSGTA